MPPLLRLFGTPALVYDEVPHRLAVPAKALALLGLLAAQPGKTVDRAQLASSLYPDEVDAQARLATRRQLHVLAKALPEGAFVLTKNTVKLSELLQTDVAYFVHEHENTQDLAHAAALRFAEYCAGVYDDALGEVRERLDRHYVKLLERLLEHANQQGNAAEAIRRLEQLLALDPLDESRVRALMELRFAQGDRSGALREYQALYQRLRADLDVEPERDTAALFQRMVFSADPSQTPHNLTAPSTSFVGRERELEQLAGKLDLNRLITIAGPPGVGKTRLARRAAFDALDRFPDGVWFVDLAPLETMSQVCEQILSVLQSRQSVAGEDVLASVTAALAGKRALLIVDNCEHISAEAATLLQALLAGTQCGMLATSRKRMAVTGEHVLALEPMDTPAPGNVRAQDIKNYSAVRLFAERAVAVSPAIRITDENAPAVAGIVRKLDGMPLAIEIVSARANLLTIEGMLKRLSEGMAAGAYRGTDSRYATVDAAIAWSYDLLSESERRLFQALSVFSGGWDIEAAEAVCAQETADVFSTLSELVEGSLVRADRTDDDIRYAMFETTLAFARARLEPGDRSNRLAREHAVYYTKLAEEHARHYKSEREVEYYRKTESEFANVRAAMAWAQHNDLPLASRLVAALWRFAIFTWRMREIEPLAAAVFADPGGCEKKNLASVHLAAGMFAKERMQQEAAAGHLEQALCLFRECADTAGEADTLYALGIVKFNHGDLSRAREYYEACLVLQEQNGDAKAIAAITANMGAIAHKMGDLEEAAALYRRALAGFRATNNDRGIAYAYRSLSLAYQDLGRYDEAIDAAQRCVEAYEALGEQSRLADGLLTLGNAFSAIGRIPESYSAFAKAFDALLLAPHPLFEALATLGYANTAHLAGDNLEAVRAAAKGRTLMEARNMGVGITYAKFVDDLIARVKAALGEEQFQAAWLAGRETALEVFAARARAQRVVD